MARIVVSDPEEGKAYQIEPEESQFQNLVGLEVGDQFDGEEIGLPGYELVITGGSDQEGFPMRSDVKGERRVKVLLSGGAGYKPPERGMRRRKSVRGGKVSRQIVQLNAKIKGRGEKPIDQILGLEPVEEELEEEVEGGNKGSEPEE